MNCMCNLLNISLYPIVISQLLGCTEENLFFALTNKSIMAERKKVRTFRHLITNAYFCVRMNISLYLNM